MIFITLGSQKFQFNRLLKAMDEISIEEEIFAQIGYSDYVPQNYKYTNFMDHDRFEELIDKSEIVICHGGTGTIIGALKKNKKVIAVPRLKKYGEHVDNHQLQLLKQFMELELICVCNDVDKLEEAIGEVRNKTYKKYISNTEIFIEDIRLFIEEV